MLDSIFSAYNGMSSFAKALAVLSNNVANMNTPGYKSTDVAFRDLFYRYSASGGGQDPLQSEVGNGSSTSSTRINFGQGQLGNTGNPLDVAVSGNGFFVLKDGSSTSYTRDGQFGIDNNGYLIERTSGARVQAIVGAGGLSDINLSSSQTSPAAATSRVSFVGNVSRDATSDQIGSINVFDSVGGTHTLSVTLTNNSTVTAGSWLVQVQDQSGKTIGNGEIRFDADGSPATGYNTIVVTLSPSGVPSSEITLNFGPAGGFNAATDFSGGSSSTLKVNTTDGYGAGSLVSTTFDAQGFITLKYSNQQSSKAAQLALASFENPQGLTELGNGLFSNPAGMRPVLGMADGQVMGTLTSNQVELSNVDLTQQFTELVILQRGYQSSSQVVSVANEMIQALVNMRTNGSNGG
jgi:flagellar hook protein FlgE